MTGDFAEVAGRVLAGDESMQTARALEAALLDQYPGDDRLDDLLEALSLYAPGSGTPYYGPEELREVLRSAMSILDQEDMQGGNGDSR